VEINDKKIVENTDNKAMSGLLSESEKITMRPILLYLENNDTIDNTKARELTGKSTATVKRYLSKLCDLGILQLTGTARSSVYIKTAQHGNRVDEVSCLAACSALRCFCSALCRRHL